MKKHLLLLVIFIASFCHVQSQEIIHEMARRYVIVNDNPIVTPVTGVTVLPATITLTIGNTALLSSTISPNNATTTSGTWSSNSANATVNSETGVVTAVSSGTATITFTTIDGDFTDTSIITISEPTGEALILKAFPDAYGGGSNATGGRGGNVYHVTNLSDPFINIDGTNYPDTDSVDYPGSFRWALNQARPATIVFDVSGILVTQSWLDWNGTDLTIAGQSAPVGGITISSVLGNRFRIRSTPDISNNLIMRYIRIRPVSESGDDAFEPFEDSTLTNVIFDHLSISYGGDEGFSLRVNPGGTLHDITFQRSILAENKTGSLFGTSWDSEYPTPEETIVGYNMSWLNNLSFNNSHRSPNLTSNGRYDWINNIVHNWEDHVGAMYGDVQANLINNYFSLGERTHFNGANRIGYNPTDQTKYVEHGGMTIEYYDNTTTGSYAFTPSVYMNGNYVDKDTEDENILVNDDNWNMMWKWATFRWCVDGSKPCGSLTPAFGNPLTDYPAKNVYRAEVADESYRTLTPFTQIGNAMPIQSALDAYNDVRTDSGANASLNADGTVSYYTDAPDTEYLEVIATEGDFIHYNQTGQDKPYDFNPTFQTYKASVLAIDGISAPINTRPVDFYGTNQHIPQAYLAANGIPNTPNVHNELTAVGYTQLEVYLNKVDGVFVIPDPIAVTGVTVTPDPSRVEINGEPLQMVVGFQPINATIQTGTWSISPLGLATITAGGLLTGLVAGNIAVTFTATDEGYQDTVQITVDPETIYLAQSILVTPTTASITIGNTVQLTTAFTPSNTTNQNMNWESTNQSVATVDANGLVSGLSVGTTTITTTSIDGGHTDTTPITVTAQIDTGLILNGTFSDGTDIILGRGWQILNGELYWGASFDGEDAVFTTSEDIVNGGNYNLDFDITTGGTNRFSIVIDGVIVVPTATYPTGLGQTINFTYTGSPIASIAIRGSNNGGGNEFTLDNVILTKL